MNTQDFNKEASNILMRSYNRKNASKWADLKLEIQAFQEKTVRTWNNAIYVLIRSGLELEAMKEKAEQETAEQAKR